MLQLNCCYAGALDQGVYAEGLRAAGLVDVRVEPKGDASDNVTSLKGLIFSAAITARKPSSQ